MSLLTRRLRAVITPNFRYGRCYRCRRGWNIATEHSTRYQELTETQIGRACFPLCQECWAELTPSQRLPYYRKLYDRWEELRVVLDADRWERIEAAVLAGL